MGQTRDGNVPQSGEIGGSGRSAADGSGRSAADVMPLFEMRGISKSFASVRVLDQIDFDVRAGEVHALCGENGAGKSTLMKIMGGVFPANEGRLLLGGREVHFAHPAAARAAGIGVIHQELSLLIHRTVAENILLGREPAKGGVIDRRRLAAQARAALHRLGAAIPPEVPVSGLSIAEQQVVEIAKAIALEAQILVFDEPTAPLDTQETEKLFRLIAELRGARVGIVYISHRMHEIFQIADRVTVLKDGRAMGTLAAADATQEKIIRLMVGREIDIAPRNSAAARAAEVRPVLLRVENGGNEALTRIDLTLHAGEIVGVAGLEGSGKAALARALFGDVPFTTGRVSCWDGDGAPRRPREAARRGIAYLSADRKAEGLGLRQSLRDNAALALRNLGHALAAPWAGVRQPARIDSFFRDVELRAADVGGTVGQLSGGNQQKVIVARWLATTARVWIIVEPTRGIDIGAKATIHALLRRFVETGGAVLMVSSDLIEIIGASDRILVMGGGRILAELPADATEEAIMAHAVHGPGETAEMVA